MTDPTRDEAILALLGAEQAGSLAIADRLSIPERAVRRRLRRLIEDGYVFSPTRGRYRITAAGLDAIAPLLGDAPDGRPRHALYPLFRRR